MSKSGGYNPATFVPEAGAASAIPDPVDPMAAYMSNMATYGVVFDFDDKELDININMKDAMTAIQALQNSGLVSFIDDDSISNYPYSVIIENVSFPLTLNILKFIYGQNAALDNIAVHVNIVPASGGDSQSCYYLNSSLAWIGSLDDANNVESNIKSAPGFIMENWCTNILTKENR